MQQVGDIRAQRDIRTLSRERSEPSPVPFPLAGSGRRRAPEDRGEAQRSRRSGGGEPTAGKKSIVKTFDKNAMLAARQKLTFLTSSVDKNGKIDLCKCLMQKGNLPLLYLFNTS